MYKIKRVYLIAWALASLAAGGASPANLSLTAGFFKFNATDYYYPNFYDETGFRGEINYAPSSVQRHNLRLQFYGYPGDDNIFEVAVEYGRRFPVRFGAWSLELMPAAGEGVTKLQYPLPYYPTVKPQYLTWIRGGGDAAIARLFTGSVSLAGGYRFRFLYYLGSSYGSLAKSEGGDPFHFLHTPYGEVKFAFAGAWAFLGRGGAEWDGYYDAVFMNRDEKLRPFGELGFGYSW